MIETSHDTDTRPRMHARLDEDLLAVNRILLGRSAVLVGVNSTDGVTITGLNVKAIGIPDTIMRQAVFMLAEHFCANAGPTQ